MKKLKAESLEDRVLHRKHSIPPLKVLKVHCSLALILIQLLEEAWTKASLISARPPSLAFTLSPYILYSLLFFVSCFPNCLTYSHLLFLPPSLSFPLISSSQHQGCGLPAKGPSEKRKTLKVTPDICCTPPPDPQSKALFDCLPMKLIRVAINNLV